MPIDLEIFELSRFTGPLEVVTLVPARVGHMADLAFVKKAAVLYSSSLGLTCTEYERNRLALSGPGPFTTPGLATRRLIASWLMSLDQVELISLRRAGPRSAFGLKFELLPSQRR